jgi:hypothetical protein
LGYASAHTQVLEPDGAKISASDNRTFETEGQVIERSVRRTIEGRDVVARNLVGAVYRFRDAVLVEEKKGDFANALQNLYRS